MKKLIIAAMTAVIASVSCTKEITSYQTDNCEIYDILWTATQYS